jgi:hypothetical protein
MKNRTLMFLLLFAVSSAFTFQIFKTTLKVIVRTELGNLAQGVKVTLYNNAEDYNAEQNPVQSGETDKKGVIYFEELEAKPYYISAEKGDMNNFGAGEKTDTLRPKHINQVTVIISE